MRPIPTIALGGGAVSLGLVLGAGVRAAGDASLEPRDLLAPPPAEALATITVDEVEADVRYLASPALEGRDSPSRGLSLAQRHVVECFAAAGLVPAPDSTDAWSKVHGERAAPDWAVHEEGGVWLRPYERAKLLFDRIALADPDPEGCALESDGLRTFEYGVDYVPLLGFEGEASGELVFAGFGIENAEERYDDLARANVRGKVVAILSGEPEHRRKFNGPDVTAEASVWNKVDHLARNGAAAVLVVRRPPELEKGEVAPALSFRHTRATWIAPTNDRVRQTVPTLEITAEAAEELLGLDPLAWGATIDRSGKAKRARELDRVVRVACATRTGPVALHNVIGVLPGADPKLRSEFVMVGAHLDHIGVGPRERVGRGADDNASGTAAMMEVAEALASGRPGRSVVFAGFSAEEDGLIGSQELARDLPVPRDSLVAMVNLDMIGRGKRNEVVALGFQPNPGMKDAVERAQRLGKTGVRRVEDCRDGQLFKRSDHYSFHQIDVPTVFFFENYPLEQNRDYHTWRDHPDLVDFDKVRNTARLAYLTTWVLASDEGRLPRPK